jgi:hypothetical protein
MPGRPLLLFLLLAAGAGPTGAVELTIDASSPPALPKPLSFAVGGTSPDGHALSANSRFLTGDGLPWFPVMGEFHYSRYPAGEWETELLKMKAGGITVVSTYVFWIHHEETQGNFDWTGRRDLRRFVELCARHGLCAWIRTGPWAHGEARNGGFPDWLVQSGVPLRQDNPRYLEWARRFYGEIGRQLRGLFWKDGGPIVGVQIENEYQPAAGGIEHMRTLLRLAHAAGIDAPLYTATGWDKATVPPEGFLPVFGGYTEQFWSESLVELPPNPNFFFTPIHAEDNVMGDLGPKNPAYNARFDAFPFLTAEMGGGMAIAYHRRPVMHADDSAAASLVKLGSGIAGLGFYMYHGGTNPDGLTPLEETQLGWNGYNDLEAKSYDFQAPLGEFGQENESYRVIRTLNLFLADFGSSLAPMPSFFPSPHPRDSSDAATPRAAARLDGQGRGFIFINNYERNYVLGEKPDFRVILRLPSGVPVPSEVPVPNCAVTIPDGAFMIWPVNLEVGGATLRYATAQPLCRLSDPETFVFFAWPGLPPEFAFAAGPGTRVSAPGTRIARVGDTIDVTGIVPGSGPAMEVQSGDGRQTRIVILTRAQALHIAKARLGGRERLAVSEAAMVFDDTRIHLSASIPADLAVELFPALPRPGAEFREAGADGIFRRYVPSGEIPGKAPAIRVSPIQAAGPSLPSKINTEPRRRVAMEPGDGDFGRAAVWRLSFPDGAPAPADRVPLRIAYEGDVARLYAGDRFADDNFYKGPPWEIGLWRFTPRELAAGLVLKILPLRRDTPLFLERSARAAFPPSGDVLRLKAVTLAPEYRAEMEIAE